MVGPVPGSLPTAAPIALAGGLPAQADDNLTDDPTTTVLQPTTRTRTEIIVYSADKSHGW